MNRRAQSIIEYALIAVLVILGIVTMGPYVLRSIGAHFQLWDDSAQDSFSENLTQAPVNDIPVINENCKCTNTSGSCGSSIDGGQGSCAANQRNINHNCNPQGCDGEPASSCKDDNTCCGAYSPEGCGTVPIPSTGIPSGSSSPTSNNCYFNQRIYATQCANNPIECQPDTTCAPTCLGNIPNGATLCPGTTNDLDQNYSYTQVQASSQSTCASMANCTTYCGQPNVKCQYYAPPPYIIGISFLGQTIVNCRLQTLVYDEGGDLGPWGWTLDVTTGRFTHGVGNGADYFPILNLHMSDGTTQKVNLNSYSNNATLPGDWSHIIGATIQITAHAPINSGDGNYLELDSNPPKQIGIDWKDGNNSNRGNDCWNMCVTVNTSDGNGINGC